MVELVVAVGLPASGKDTYYNDILKDKGFVHVASDNIRAEVFGDVNDQKHNAEVFDIMMKRVKEALREGHSCYYNATNLNAKRRMNFIKELRNRVENKFYASCIVFATPYEECCGRNKNRERTVPDYAMERMYKNFQPPSYAEGWDVISIIKSSSSNISIDERLKKLIQISHDNPHHSLTIGKHLIKAYNYCIEKNFPHEVSIAALWHDEGKFFTKVFCNIKGEPTSIAHYYSHENISAYNFLTTENGNVRELLEIATLIWLHMSFYQGEARLKKIKQIYGEDFFHKLELLHLADQFAH